MKAFSYSLSQKKGKKIKNAVVDRNPYLKVNTLVNSKYTNSSGIKIVKNTNSLKKLEQSTKIDIPHEYFDVKSMIINSIKLLNYIYPLQPEIDGEMQILKLNVKLTTDTIICKNIISSHDIDIDTNNINLSNNMEFNVNAINNKLLEYFNGTDHDTNFGISTRIDDFMKINNCIIASDFFVGNMSEKNLSDESVIFNMTPSNKLNMISTNSGTIDDIRTFHEDILFETNVDIDYISNKFISDIQNINQSNHNYQSTNLELNLNMNASKLNNLFDNLFISEIIEGNFDYEKQEQHQEKEKEKEKEKKQEQEQYQESEQFIASPTFSIGNMFNGIHKNAEFMKMVPIDNKIIRVEEINNKNLLFEKNIDATNNNNPNKFFSNIQNDITKKKPTSSNLELNMNTTTNALNNLFMNSLENSNATINSYLFIGNVTNKSELTEDIIKLNKISSNKLAMGFANNEMIDSIKPHAENVSFEKSTNNSLTKLILTNVDVDIIKPPVENALMENIIINNKLSNLNSMNENIDVIDHIPFENTTKIFSINRNADVIKSITDNTLFENATNNNSSKLSLMDENIDVIAQHTENLLFENTFNNSSNKSYLINTSIDIIKLHSENTSSTENINKINPYFKNLLFENITDNNSSKSFSMTVNEYINSIKPQPEKLLFETPFNNTTIKIFPVNDNVDLTTLQLSKRTNLQLSTTTFDSTEQQIIQDALKSLRAKCKCVTNVYQLVYNSNASASGFGDFIRGSYFLMEFCQKYNFKCLIDISNHPIKKCLKKYSNIQLSETQSNVYKKINKFEITNFRPTLDANNIIGNQPNTHDVFNDFLIYLNSQQNINGNIHVYNINYPTETYAHIFKHQMQEILQPTDRIKLYVDMKLKSLNMRPNSYEVIHIRCGDDFFGKNIKSDSINLNFIFHELKNLNPNKKYLIISDNSYFKELIKNRYDFVNILNHKIVHTSSNSVKTADLENAMLDFYLMSKSNNLVSYSVYSHGSGFSKWCAYTYNIPYVCKYIGVK
jgi:hypothetical protein